MPKFITQTSMWLQRSPVANRNPEVWGKAKTNMTLVTIIKLQKPTAPFLYGKHMFYVNSQTGMAWIWVILTLLF